MATAAATSESAPQLYREHAPMLKLLSQIPARVHRGLVGYDLNLTCVAAHHKFLGKRLHVRVQ